MTVDAVKVLVVDDGRENCEFVVQYVLKPAGYLPLVAFDGLQGLELVHQHQPDVILLDLQMPRMNGLEFLDALQREGLDIPVILMTFFGSEEIAIEVYRKGVRDYVKKPYTVDEMLNALDRCLGEVRLRREKDALTRRLLRANANLSRRIRELNALYQIGRSVTALVSMDELMLRIVDAATQVIGAEEGTLFLAEGDQLLCRATKGSADLQARLVCSASADPVAWRVARSGEPLLAAPDERTPVREAQPDLPVAVAAVPLKIGSRVVGVLSVQNTQAGTRPFGQQDGAMLAALGDYAAIAIENARIYTALEEATGREKQLVRGVFERYAAAGVVDPMLQNPNALQHGGTRQVISALVADVRGFGAYSQDAAPEAAVQRLNAYFGAAVEVIFSREGTLDKFLGDAVVAFFNAPEAQPDHAYRAAEAALALQQRVAQQFADENGPGLAFGIGVHMGEALVGYFGTAATRTYTAIGEATAVADQIQAHAAPGEVLISGELYAALQGRAEVEALGTLEVKGRAEPVQVLRLLALS